MNYLFFSKSVLNSSSILPVKSSFGDLQIRIKVNLSDRQAYGTTDRPENKVETEEILKKIRDSYKRNKKIFQEITQVSNLYKVNYLGDVDFEKPTKTIEENYFFEFNKVLKRIVTHKIKRKIGLKFLKIISKL